MEQILREGYVVESDFSFGFVNIYLIAFRKEDLEEDFFIENAEFQ